MEMASRAEDTKVGNVTVVPVAVNVMGLQNDNLLVPTALGAPRTVVGESTQTVLNSLAPRAVDAPLSCHDALSISGVIALGAASGLPRFPSAPVTDSTFGGDVLVTDNAWSLVTVLRHSTPPSVDITPNYTTNLIDSVTPRHSPQGKAVTSTKGHPSGVVACSELQANEPAEAAEMTARRTLRVRNSGGIFTNLSHRGQQFKAACPMFRQPRVAGFGAQSQELFQNGDLAQLSVRKAAALEQGKHSLDTCGVHNVPGNGGLIFVGLAVATRHERPGVVSSDVAAQTSLDSIQNGAAVIALDKAGAGPELIVNVGNGRRRATFAALPHVRVVNQANLKATLAKKEAAKLGRPQRLNRLAVNVRNHNNPLLTQSSISYHNVGCKASTVHKQQVDQWEVLLAADTIAAATVAVAPGFQDRMTNSGGFFNIPKFTGITFVITNAIDIASTAAYGLMYAPSALAVDTRKQFDIEPQRDASKQAWELNASMWYVAGVWNKNMGVLLRHNASTPS